MSTDDESGRREHAQPQVKPHQDETRLRELYHDEGLTQEEIAERFDIDQSTVSYWFDKFGIETDSRTFHRMEHSNGKVQLQPAGTDEQSFYIHQIVALQDYSVSEVFDEDTHIHHLMAAPFSVDLSENLEVLDAGEHSRRHAEGTATVEPEKVLQHIFGEFELELTPPDTNKRTKTSRLHKWSDRVQVSTDNGTSTGQADD